MPWRHRHQLGTQHLRIGVCQEEPIIHVLESCRIKVCWIGVEIRVDASIDPQDKVPPQSKFGRTGCETVFHNQFQMREFWKVRLKQSVDRVIVMKIVAPATKGPPHSGPVEMCRQASGFASLMHNHGYLSGCDRMRFWIVHVNHSSQPGWTLWSL